MARKLRLEYPGAIYHVINRGDRRESIFHDDADRKRFVETLAECCTKTGWHAHAYCLVPGIGDTLGLEEGADEWHVKLDGEEVLFHAPA